GVAMRVDDRPHRRRASNENRNAIASFAQGAGNNENPSGYRRRWLAKSLARPRRRGGRRERNIGTDEAVLPQNLRVPSSAQPRGLSLKFGRVTKPSQHRIVASWLQESHCPLKNRIQYRSCMHDVEIQWREITAKMQLRIVI